MTMKVRMRVAFIYGQFLKKCRILFG